MAKLRERVGVQLPRDSDGIGEEPFLQRLPHTNHSQTCLKNCKLQADQVSALVLGVIVSMSCPVSQVAPRLRDGFHGSGRFVYEDHRKNHRQRASLDERRTITTEGGRKNKGRPVSVSLSLSFYLRLRLCLCACDRVCGCDSDSCCAWWWGPPLSKESCSGTRVVRWRMNFRSHSSWCVRRQGCFYVGAGNHDIMFGTPEMRPKSPSLSCT